MKRIITSCIIIMVLFVVHAQTENQFAGPWNMDILYQAPEWETTTVAAVDGMSAILYRSIDYKGKPVDVFAYYSAPAGEAPEGGWPALVHVHGGGGTAYPEWVQKWNEHGYACISMDLEGHIPVKDESGQRLPTPNPGPSRIGIFGDWDIPIENQWYYHAVAQIVKAHSLICSFPEINPAKTGISGASWGGTLTSTVMGVDTTFCFAIPVYGSGYIAGSDGNQGVVLSIGSPQTDFVNENYDGSAYFTRVTYPTLWFNGTNDTHFDLTCTQRSAQAVNGRATLRYTLNMRHSNLEILKYDEIYAFADQVTKGEIPLPVIGKPRESNGVGSVRFYAEDSITSAEIFYTLDDGSWIERSWQHNSASISDTTISAIIPNNATTIFFTATDERGLMISSEYLSVDLPNNEYKVTFRVKDTQTDSLLEDISILIDQEKKITSVNGEAEFFLTRGSYVYSIDHTGYFNITSTLGVISDTVIQVSLKESPKLIIFDIHSEDTGNPLPDISVKIGDTEFTTGINGQAIFNLYKGGYEYSINHSDYFSINEFVELANDTTIEISLESNIANIKFRIYSEGSPLYNVSLKINEYSITTNQTGVAVFKKMTKYEEYNWSASKDGFEELEGNISLIRDTTVNLSMSQSTLIENPVLPGLSAYPNPTRNAFSVKSDEKIQQIEICELSGSLLKNILVHDTKAKIDLSGYPNGFYILKIYRNEQRTENIKLIKSNYR